MSKNNNKRNFEARPVKKEVTLPHPGEKAVIKNLPHNTDDTVETKTLPHVEGYDSREKIRLELSKELLEAAQRQLPEPITKAAQKIYAAGFELEDMKIPHHAFAIVCNTLSNAGFVPVKPEQVLEKPAQYRDPHL